MSDFPKTYHLDYLANHKDKIPQVARWLNNEWGYIHPDRSYQDLCHQLEERVNFTTPPIHIVAFDGGLYTQLGWKSLEEITEKIPGQGSGQTSEQSIKVLVMEKQL